MNSLTTLSNLEQQISDARARMVAAGNDDVAKCLKSLQAAGLGIASGIAPKEVNTVYSFALADLSREALNITTRKLIRGEYDIDRKDFIPKPPELAAMVRAEARVLAADISRLTATADAIRPQEPVIISEEMRSRAREKLAQFRVWHAEAKVAERYGNVKEPMSEERASMLSRIMALPDAKEVTADQAAYRRRVAAELNASAEQEAAE